MTYIENSDTLPKEQILIKVQKECQHTASKATIKETSETIETKNFVNDFFSSNGISLSENQWQTPREVILSNCPSSTLHSLAIEAERQGKTITYSRSLTIKISD